MLNVNSTLVTTALDGLSSPHQDELRQVLAPVDAEVLQQWVESGALREWVSHGLRLFDGGQTAARVDLSTFLTATPTMLAALSTREISEWARVGLDLRSVDARVFSQLPSGFSDLTETERVGF